MHPLIGGIVSWQSKSTCFRTARFVTSHGGVSTWIPRSQIGHPLPGFFCCWAETGKYDKVSSPFLNYLVGDTLTETPKSSSNQVGRVGGEFVRIFLRFDYLK